MPIEHAHFMRRSRVAIGLGAIVFLAMVGWVWIPLQLERVHIRKRVEALRSVLRSGNIEGVAAFIIPERLASQHTRAYRGHYRIRLEDYGMRVGTDASVPAVWINGDIADVTPHVEYHLGIIPGGDSLEMIKHDGEWYFSGALFID